MIVRFLFIVLTLMTIQGFGQVNIQWEARYNGVGNFIDKAFDLSIDDEGNTFVTGASHSGVSFDWATVKYDTDGIEQWVATYGGTGIDEAKSLALDSNGDVIVTGTRFISGTDWDMVTIKYDGTTGAELWVVIEPGTGKFDTGKDVAIDADDNVIVVGSVTTSDVDIDYFTVKYDTDGTELWSNLFGGTRSDNAKLVRLDDAGNIYIAGDYEYTVETTYFDFCLLKYNPAGTLLWSATEDSGFGKLDTPFAMKLDADNDIIIGGSGFTDILNEEDYLTMKFSGESGALDWKRFYAGDAEALDVVNAIAIDATKNVYVTGKSKSIATSEDYYTIAYDMDGTELWAKRYTTAGLRYDEAKDIRVSSDNDFVYVTGYSYYPGSNNDYTTVKYDVVDGNQEWTTVFDGPAGNSDQALKMKLDLDNNIYVTGNSHGGATNLDFSTIKYCELTTEASSDTIICLGESVDLEATGGDNITWAVFSGDEESMSCEMCETMTATPDETTVYIVSSESEAGCVDFDTVTVTVNLSPEVEIYHDTPLTFCDGDSVVLYADDFETYTWSTGSETSETTVHETMTVTLTVVDEFTCENETSVDILVNDLPVIDAGEDVGICPGEEIELLATGADEYAWNPDVTLSSFIIANPIASPETDNAYIVTGTDDAGCSSSDTVVVEVYPLPSVNAGSDETICLGDSVHLLATGAVSYEWTYHPTLTELEIPDPWAVPLGFTEYFVTGTDDNGCQNIDSVNIATLAMPDIDAGSDTSVCAGGSVQLFASGGIADLYVWNDDPTLSELDVYNPFATPITETIYYVEGTDINGCSNIDSVTVSIHELPTIDAGPDENLCLGDSVQLLATGGVIYTWDSDPSLSDLDIPDPWAFPISDKVYTVTAVDAFGCVNSDEVAVVIVEAPEISAGLDVEVCLGDSTQLEATGGVVYTWEFDPTLSNFLISDPWASPEVTTVYTVEGIDAFGCSNTDEVTVTVLPTPTPPVLTVDSVFIISSIVDGIQWYLDEDELFGETNDSLNYVEIGENGEYWVLYTDENGCTVTSDRIDNPIFITDVGIQDNELAIELKLYPNPTSGLLNIEINEAIDRVVIYTMDGRIISQRENLAQGTHQFDLLELERGTYFMQFLKDNQSIVKQIVKH